MKSKAFSLLTLLSFVALLYTACSKGDDEPNDPCAGVTVSVTGTPTNATTGQSNGSIAVSATGGSGFTYSLNGGAFQSGATFGNLAAGTYTVVAKNANGCTGSAQVTVGTGTTGGGECSGTAGPLFTAVKAVLQANCVSCHNASNSQGGMNWAVDCNIVTNRARIKARAVDAAGTANQMPPPPNPPLSTADRQKITDWIAAGGNFSN